MVEKKYHDKTLVVLVGLEGGGRGWKEGWRVYGLYTVPMKGEVFKEVKFGL